MSKKDATAFAASLAAMPADEYDGDETLIALEIDPWQ